ncbi:TspO/MBR family protein [Micavibrio aeruginosavorus]|uniref:TspO/MBR family protein n=1 Tax=Micavibrio aeruginosavorus TaxID=349221 RepID=UPI003F4A8D8B
MITKPMFTRRDLILLPACILTLPVLGALVGYATRPGVDGWYQTAMKSALTPPDYVFGIVWSVLYLLMGFYLWRIARRAPGDSGYDSRRFLLRLFIAQLIANLAWSFIFFQMQALWLAVVWIIGLIAAVGVLIKRTYRLDRWAALALAPLLGWMCFALYLSTFVAMHAS